MKFCHAYDKLLLACALTTGVLSFTFHRPVKLSPHGTSLTIPSSYLQALQAPMEADANHHVKAVAGALALASLMLLANPAPLHEGTHPPTSFPSLIVSHQETVVAPASATVAKLQVSPMPGFGFGGAGVSPFGVGPFGAFGGGVIIRNVPDDTTTTPTAQSTHSPQMIKKEQQLKALVKEQQQPRLGQYEQQLMEQHLPHIQQSQKIS